MRDKDVKLQVLDTIDRDPRVNMSHVAVTVRAGVATLSGTLSTTNEARAAIEDARKTLGVKDVINKLLIEPSIPLRSDEELLEDIGRALRDDDQVDSKHVKLKAEDGVVTIWGTVEHLGEKQAAETNTILTPGVIEAHNNLRVRTRPDDEVREDILGTWKRNELVDESRLGVGVEDGVVTITGVTKTAEEIESAEEDARLTPGVRGIQNQTETTG